MAAKLPTEMPGATLWTQWEQSKQDIERLKTELRSAIHAEKQLARQLFELLNIRTTGIRLSKRQTEVMAALITTPGMSNKEIGNMLNVTERTIKFHIAALLKIYGVQNRQGLYNRFVQSEKGGIL